MLDLQADGIIVGATMVTKQIVGDAYVSAPGEVTKSFTGDGYVISALQVTADALVTTSVTNGRLVWNSGWKLAVAERTDGSRLVGAQYAIGYSFIAPDDLDVIGLCVAVDDSDGTLTVDLVDSTNSVIATVDHTNSGVTTALNWAYLTCSGSITSGELYTVQVSGDLNVLITDNAKGKNNVTGRVLNCVVVTGEEGTWDSRDLMIAGDFNLTVDNTSLIVTYGVNTTLSGTIQKKMTNCGTVNITETLMFGNGGVLENFGTLNVTGDSKTRYVKTTSPVTYSSVVIPVDSEPTGWEEQDRLYTGNYTTVNEVDGTDVHLLSISARPLALGDGVVNVTRSAVLSGFSGEVPLTLSFGDGSTFSAENCVLRNLSEINTDMAMNDVVLDKTPLKTTAGTYTNITALSTTITTDISVNGTTVLCDSTLTVNAGVSNADFILVDGGVVLMAGTSMQSFVSGWGSSLVTVQGIAKKCSLTGEWTGDSLITITKDAGLGKLIGGDITTNSPYVTCEAGALFLGSAQLTYSTTTATRLVILGSPCFINLIDEDGEAQTTLVDGLLLDGSRVSNRYHTEFPDGKAYADVDATSSPYSVAVEGDYFQYELGRYTVSSSLSIQADVKGTGYLIFDGSDYQFVEFDTPTWDTVTLTTNPGVDEVVILYILTTSLAKVDGIVEL